MLGPTTRTFVEAPFDNGSGGRGGVRPPDVLTVPMNRERRGGRDEAGTVKGDLWGFDLASWTWGDIDLSGPKARSGSAAASAPDGSGFYYFGGQANETYYGDLWWFDFAAGSWEEITPKGSGTSDRAGVEGGTPERQ